LTLADVTHAIENLQPPNKNLSDAVKTRQEIDLRIGAVFTRFQTLGLRDALGSKYQKSIISYGPCQFPTLGFVVKRHQEIEEFRSEPFWYIQLELKSGKSKTVFNLEKVRQSDQQECESLFKKCKQPTEKARVTLVEEKPTYKRRPTPLNTVEAQKLVS
jgi:DNA topoisomerase III